MRLVTPTIIQEMCLAPPVVGPIGNNRARLPILWRHRLCWRPPAGRYESPRSILRQPDQVLIRRMLLSRAEPMLVLGTQRETQIAQPEIVLTALSGPDSTRMILPTNRPIPPLLRSLPPRSPREIRCHIKNPMRRIQKLTRLQNHFHHMFVAMPARTARRVV